MKVQEVNEACLDAREFENEIEEQFFYTSCKAGGKRCIVNIDSEICANIASPEMVEKLKLPIRNHPRPYVVPWLNENKGLTILEQTLVSFKIGSYHDDLWCDVVPMDHCHILLGSPWQVDRRVTYNEVTNVYSLVQDNKRIHLLPMTTEQVRKEQQKLRLKRETERIMICSENEVQKDLKTDSSTHLNLLFEPNDKGKQVRDMELITPLEDSKNVILGDIQAAQTPLHKVEARPSSPCPLMCNTTKIDNLDKDYEAKEHAAITTSSTLLPSEYNTFKSIENRLREEEEQPMAEASERDIMKPSPTPQCKQPLKWYDKIKLLAVLQKYDVPNQEREDRVQRRHDNAQGTKEQAYTYHSCLESLYRKYVYSFFIILIDQNMHARSGLQLLIYDLRFEDESFQEREFDAGARGPKSILRQARTYPFTLGSKQASHIGSRSKRVIKNLFLDLIGFDNKIAKPDKTRSDIEMMSMRDQEAKSTKQARPRSYYSRPKQVQPVSRSKGSCPKAHERVHGRVQTMLTSLDDQGTQEKESFHKCRVSIFRRGKFPYLKILLFSRNLTIKRLYYY